MQRGRRGGVGRMLGRKKFEPKLCSHFSLQERVPQDHLRRRGAAIVGCGFGRRLAARAASPTGPPGIDPVARFKMALLGWLYGLPSERRLAAEVRLNLACLWFVGYELDERPLDHAVLSKARPCRVWETRAVRAYGPTQQ